MPTSPPTVAGTGEVRCLEIAKLLDKISPLGKKRDSLSNEHFSYEGPVLLRSIFNSNLMNSASVRRGLIVSLNKKK